MTQITVAAFKVALMKEVQFQISEGRMDTLIKGNTARDRSVVGFKDGDKLVGQLAKRQAVTNPQNTIYSIKRFMGRKFSEVETERSEVPYEVIEGPNGDARVQADGKE